MRRFFFVPTEAATVRMPLSSRACAKIRCFIPADDEYAVLQSAACFIQ
ncbi:hypothetical protein HMPREF9555_01091 [Selenomonas artemidis F0399]|uniref:Uncharacterized protein n=1 Tax=Selenomonas artemidis F0399 TaxID=749551 RepID=E7N280_9FIRM|nr:hypothetical protein HMPREF9555_01091 [Selenomonas artemidis F0399]